MIHAVLALPLPLHITLSSGMVMAAIYAGA
jgi:hypothetical protein